MAYTGINYDNDGKEISRGTHADPEVVIYEANNADLWEAEENGRLAARFCIYDEKMDMVDSEDIERYEEE